MAPEQASGKPVDKRADIFAFGVVLWEMLTGRRMFEGETISHVLAAVLTKDRISRPCRHASVTCWRGASRRIQRSGSAISATR